MNKKIVAIFFAVLAAALYAINIPLSKLLLQHIGPTMLASYLYLGAGIGIGAVFLITKKRSSHTGERITKKDMPFVIVSRKSAIITDTDRTRSAVTRKADRNNLTSIGVGLFFQIP